MNRHGGVFLGLLIGGHSLDFDHRTLNISATGDHSFAGPYCSYEVLVHYRCFCSEARISVINLRLRKTLKSLSWMLLIFKGWGGVEGGHVSDH